MNLYPSTKLVTSALRVVFTLTIFIFYLTRFGLDRSFLNNILVFYILFLFAESMMSSDLQESLLDGFMKISFSLFMIPIGMELAKWKSNALIKPMIWMVIILLLNYILSQFFKLGTSIYDEDSFYKGGATAAAPILLTTAIIYIFHAFNKKELPYSNWIILIIVAAALFTILISVKRGAILSTIFGFVIYLLNTSRKGSSLFYLVITVGVLYVISLNFTEVLQERLEARTTERNDIQNENRYKETFYIMEELEKMSVLEIVFGKEAFNSGSIMRKYFSHSRQLHVDYNIIFLGTGVFGFLFYFFVHYSIWSQAKEFLNWVKRLANEEIRFRANEDYALIVSLMIVSFIMSFSGGLQFLSYRIILFLLIGYSLGNLNVEHLKLKFQLRKAASNN